MSALSHLKRLFCGLYVDVRVRLKQIRGRYGVRLPSLECRTDHKYTYQRCHSSSTIVNLVLTLHARTAALAPMKIYVWHRAACNSGGPDIVSTFDFITH